MTSYTPMMQQYLAIKAEYPDAFLFFRLGDFYELFFEDAEKAAEELEITLTGRDAGAAERIPMCGVPFHSVSTYIEKLINKGYKVAICDQVENPSQAKGVVKREVVRVVTPGTVMEETMLVEQENNFLVVLAHTVDKIALAAVDLSTGETHITEMAQSAPALFDEIASYQPKEIVVETSLTEQTAWLEKLQLHSKAVITSHTFSLTREIENQLTRQFPQYEELCTTPALQRVMQSLYTYLQQTQKRSLQHLQRLHKYDAAHYMIIDDVARRNLELTLTLGEGKKRGSLLWLLDQTATAMGSRQLKKWLDKPLLQVTPIQQRQMVVKSLLDDFILLDDLREMLKEVYDLERLSARVAYGSANARDLNALKDSLQMIPTLKQRLANTSCARLQQIGRSMDPCADVSDLIERTIVPDPPVSVKEGGIILEGYDHQLDELRFIQRNGKTWIAQLEQRERELTGIKSLKIGYNRIFGYYIEVTKANLRALPENRYQRKQTIATGERFITPELKEQEQRILHAEEKSVEMEYELFVQVRTKVAEQVNRLQTLAEQVAELDVLHAFAVVARKQKYTCPVVHEGDHLSIIEGRHPVVETVSKEAFTANDTLLNGEDRQILLITGPNMAGKSTYMRQIALITILAQVGSFVPASEANISIVDRIFTRIGAADDLIGGRSTFMVEMAETCHALNEATARSLILLDEIGRGTSTYDGMALAHAIVEYIHDYIGAKTLFSTHYHELTELADQLPRLVNVHAQCVERNGRVIFLHRIIPGGADRSYGIYVAELAGMPKPVVTRAKELLIELEGKERATISSTGRVATPVIKESAAPMTGQISLFELESPLTQTEREVLDQIRTWDLLNKTPLESMQLLMELQKKVK